MNNEAIGILFEVLGGGDINSGSGKRINGQLRNIVGNINKAGTLRLKFEIDSNHFKKEIDNLKKQIESLDVHNTTSGASGGKASTEQQKQIEKTKAQTKAFKEASTVVKRYYDLLGQVQKASTRTTFFNEDASTGQFEQNSAAMQSEIERWSELSKQYIDAKEDFERVTSKDNKAKMSPEQVDSLNASIISSQNRFNIQSTGNISNAQMAWGNLTAKVHDYISRVEYAASRNKEASKSLQQLREMANSTDYKGYDTLKEKLQEVQHFINQNGLATETWGQKLAKTFGSRIRSAFAGILTAKVGLYIRDVYNNVVELDKAVTDLQIASGKNREETEKLIVTYGKLGQQLGATTVEVAKSADTWLRQGYSAQEATTLIANSMMLSKLGQIEAADAARNLTSAMKGYQVSVEDSVSIVDKFTTVDMIAAASAGDIATAMAETAASASVAGVSMDKLIGYLATVKEVTQDGAESVGTFYKTLFARMNNVSAGKFVDEDTGESLNDVETVLNELGISLRDTNGLFKQSSVVLDEVSAQWDSFNNVQQHAIATAFAGTRQQEKFIVLMENYESALDYTAAAAGSAGTATEKYEVYANSLEGRINSLTSSFEMLSKSMLNSDAIIGTMTVLSNILAGLNSLLSAGNGGVMTFIASVGLSVIAIALLNKALTGLGLNANLAKISFGDLVAAIQLGSSQIGAALLTLIKNPIMYIALLAAAFTTFSDKLNGSSAIIVGAVLAIGTGVVMACSMANAAVWGFMASNPLGWILLAITAVVLAIKAVVKGISDLIVTESEHREMAMENAKAAQEEADAIREVADSADKAAKSIYNLTEELKSLQESEESDAADWMDRISEIGLEIAKLYPEEHLTSLQAINKLLDSELNYNDLINMSMEKRLGLLHDIESGTFNASYNASKKAYNAQKNASELLSSALKYGYKVEKENWGNLKDSEIKSAQREAEEIAGKLNNGISVDGNTIRVSSANLLEYVNKLRSMVDEYESRYQYNFGALSSNAIYQYLASSLTEAENSLNAQKSSLQSMIESSAMMHGLNMNIEFNKSSTKEEAKHVYDNTIDALISEIRKDKTVSTAIADGLIDESMLSEYAQEYIRKYHKELYNAANDMPVIIPVKSAIDIFDNLNEEFGLLKNAIDEFSESGTVSAKTIRSMTDEFPELLKYIKQTENGFELIEESGEKIMSEYWAKKSKEYSDDIDAAYAYYQSVVSAYDGTLESYKIVKEAYAQLQNAIDNGNNFITAQNVMTDSILEEQYTDILNEQKDALKDQLDEYAKLCDIRKELLKTYKAEKDYNDDLIKKQKAISRLQSRLSVARLDTSALGQSNVRKLEEELEQAKDDLEDFTLEHAIDVLTKQIDDSNEQYKQIIDSGVKRLEDAINHVGAMTAEAIKQAISEAGKEPITGTTGQTTGSITDSIGNVQNGVNGGNKLPENVPVKPPTKYEEEPSQPENITPPKSILESGTDYSVSGVSAISWGKDDITVTIGGKKYDTKIGPKVESQAIINGLNNLYDGKMPKNETVSVYGGIAYIVDGQKWRELVEEDTTQLTNHYLDMMNNYPTHHSGGFVGGGTKIASNEEFAKLLKGELVVTPKQMSNFMSRTLPSMLLGGHSVNEFNAPLISIECDSVTEESLPKVKDIVNQAVSEVKRQLDEGMQRTGRKTSVKKLLIP